MVPARGWAGDAKRVTAVRAEGSIRVDGRLSEASWASAPRQESFWQLAPQEGAAPQQNTSFQVLYDDDAIYIGVRAFDSSPAAIRGVLTRRDQDSTSDWITVSIDSYGDKRTAFSFSLNPAGVQVDMRLFDDVKDDIGWDAVWEGTTSTDEIGWVAEYRIPFTQLRFARRDEQEWGIQVQRYVQRTQEVTFWSATPSDRDQLVSLFGRVDGIRTIPPVRRLELMPYAVSGMHVADAADPLAAAGLDFKYGLASNFTIAGAVNPDFRQVEVDPSVVNLTDREVFLPEKRPFFLEGAAILRFGLTEGAISNPSEQLLYTRRIGAPPQRELDATGDRNTTIYGAAALTGKTANGLSIGALSAITADETRATEVSPNMIEQVAVEPLTSYNVLRVGRDINDGRTTIGGIATGAFRRLGGTGIDTLHDRALTAGLTLQHRSEGGAWSSSLAVMGSDVHGAAAALDRTQRASQRYYQRPDATHLDYDPAREHLMGFGMSAATSLAPNKHWRLATGADSRSPGLEVNDLGFQLAADYTTPWAAIQYRDVVAGDHVQRWSSDLVLRSTWDWNPDYLGSSVDANAALTLRSFWGIYGGGSLEADALDTKLLRGGPAVSGRDRYRGRVGIFSDERRAVRFVVEANGFVEPVSESWQAAVTSNIVVQPRSNIALSIGPTVIRGVSSLQYVDSPVDELGGVHYVLGRVDQSIAALTMRAAYTVSPRLSIQWYAQPFIAGGKFDRYKQAVRPRAASPDEQFYTFAMSELVENGGTFGVDGDGDGRAELEFPRADFNVRELRSTFVTRWEYRPGSTVFLIWSHDRSGFADDGTLQPSHDLQELARERGVHTVLFKLSYWWTP